MKEVEERHWHGAGRGINDPFLHWYFWCLLRIIAPPAANTHDERVTSSPRSLLSFTLRPPSSFSPGYLVSSRRIVSVEFGELEPTLQKPSCLGDPAKLVEFHRRDFRSREFPRISAVRSGITRVSSERNNNNITISRIAKDLRGTHESCFENLERSVVVSTSRRRYLFLVSANVSDVATVQRRSVPALSLDLG